MSDDIFKLLLIMLLIISDRESGCNGNSLFSSLNTLIIVTLLFKTDEIGNSETTATSGLFPQ